VGELSELFCVVLCCVQQSYTCSDTDTLEQFLKLNIWFFDLGLVSVCLFRFSILYVFCSSLAYFVLVLFAFVVFGLIYIHTGFIGIWQPEAGLNKHTHINTHKILGLGLFVHYIFSSFSS